MIASTQNASRHIEYSFKKLLFVICINTTNTTTNTIIGCRSGCDDDDDDDHGQPRMYAHLVHTNATSTKQFKSGKISLIAHKLNMPAHALSTHHTPNCFPFGQCEREHNSDNCSAHIHILLNHRITDECHSKHSLDHELLRKQSRLMRIPTQKLHIFNRKILYTRMIRRCDGLRKHQRLFFFSPLDRFFWMTKEKEEHTNRKIDVFFFAHASKTLSIIIFSTFIDFLIYLCTLFANHSF